MLLIINIIENLISFIYLVFGPFFTKKKEKNIYKNS